MLAMFCLAQKTKVWRQLAGHKKEFVEMACRRSRHILELQPKISDTVRSSSEALTHLKGNYLAVSEHAKPSHQSVPYNERNLLRFPKFVSDNK